MSLCIQATMARRAPLLKRAFGNALLLAAVVALGACQTIGSITGTGGGPRQGQAGFVRGFLGGIAAEEPRAAVVAREVLSAGGSATDAAVALGFALSVSLPSRAALGGGGVCLVWNAQRVETLGFEFTARPPSSIEPGDDRPAAVPLLARGLFAMHARGGGRLQFERLVAPAEAMARFGILTSRALARDLAPVADLLARDPSAAAVFLPQGRPLVEGDQMLQGELAGTLGLIRGQGPGELHQGQLARRIAESSAAAGGTLSLADLRAAVPRVEPAGGVRVGNDLAYAGPDPGSAAALEAFRAGQPTAADRGGVSGASTAFIVFDRDGNAVACALTMNNLFGTGRMVPGTGMLLAAAPTGRVQPPPLPAMIIANDRVRALRFAGAASGGAGAPAALAQVALATVTNRGGLAEAIAAPRPGLSQGEGRVSAVYCPSLFSAREISCAFASDPRGAGLAVGGE
jgi:gamma-glutamyltranspeptidase/glutathione hydrolase